MALWEWGCLVLPPPLCHVVVFGGFKFLWPVAVCAGGPLLASGGGVVSCSAGLVTGALAGKGRVSPHRESGGHCILACVVWFGALS